MIFAVRRHLIIRRLQPGWASIGRNGVLFCMGRKAIGSYVRSLLLADDDVVSDRN